mmetsp:Transcript_88760/g.248374  ORF Transcript_88760/g.248374 Transcript_88760/m.248374 type:complete len:302 (+) Transcript_88760:71-976(+)
MVYFECQNCNETVKKPKLKKHLESCGSHYVSCIDCCKVFAWNEWEVHTSCISEAQKYQGKLYEGKESSNKGQKKQDTWVDNVQKMVEDPTSAIAAHTRSNMEKLLGFTNIPRKQKPFANFVKNSCKIWDERKIGEMWDVIAAANAKPAAPATTEAPKAEQPAEKSGKEGEGKSAKNCAEVEEADADEAPEKPTKKSKKRAAEAEEADEPEDTEVKAEKKEKKSKKAEVAWEGWKAAVDEELASNDNELPWTALREALVARFRASGMANGESEESLFKQALEEIPEKYLLVRRPAKKQKKDK